MKHTIPQFKRPDTLRLYSLAYLNMQLLCESQMSVTPYWYRASYGNLDILKLFWFTNRRPVTNSWTIWNSRPLGVSGSWIYKLGQRLRCNFISKVENFVYSCLVESFCSTGNPLSKSLVSIIFFKYLKIVLFKKLNLWIIWWFSDYYPTTKDSQRIQLLFKGDGRRANYFWEILIFDVPFLWNPIPVTFLNFFYMAALFDAFAFLSLYLIRLERFSFRCRFLAKVRTSGLYMFCET